MVPSGHGGQSGTAGDRMKAIIMNEEQELEDYIKDWYYGDEMHEFAKALGRYLLKFIVYLHKQDMSEKTRRKHIDNCWCIGYLECNFGYHDEFVPGSVFYSPSAGHEYDFARKFSSSKSAMASYKSTMRNLYAYTKGLGHLAGAEEAPAIGSSRMIETNAGWSKKGGSLSDKSARKEFGLTQEEIVQAINEGKLQYRVQSIHGNPFLRLLRSEVEALVEGKHGINYLTGKRYQVELSRVNREIKSLKLQLESLEMKRTELQEMLAE